MDIDMDKKHWDDKKCPKYDCRKGACKCGLKKVFLASVLGDDSKDSPIAPKNGAYCDAIVVYEANGHIYIYSKEGIPTLITSGGGGDYDEIIKEIQDDLAKTEDDLAKEVLDRADGDNTLQNEIDAIKNSPDVVDIVPTYAALQAYDTSSLGDNDIIRVLQDEQHDGQSTYYRWNKQSSTWTYIGAVGDYYTKGQVDNLIDSNKGTYKTLTVADYNFPASAPDGIAPWLLDEGLYTKPVGVYMYTDKTTRVMSGVQVGINVLSKAKDSSSRRGCAIYSNGDGNGTSIITTARENGDGLVNSIIPRQVVDDLTDTSTNKSLSANQGKVLKDLIDSRVISGAGAPTTATAGTVGQLYEDTTNGDLYICTDATNPYVWEAVGAGGGPTVVQTTGASTTDVMSQNATTAMIYSNPATPNTIQIGSGATNQGRLDSMAIGGNAYIPSNISGASALGYNAAARVTNSIALGSNSNATLQGELSIGNPTRTDFYNGTGYRLLTNVHDPVSAHDAATKGYVDANAGGVKTLTSADYNYHYGGTTDNGIGIWLLDEGEYVFEDGTTVYTNSTSTTSASGNGIIVLIKPTTTHRGSFIYTYPSAKPDLIYGMDEAGQSGTTLKFPVTVSNSLTSTSTTNALSAAKGKELKDLIDGLVITNAGAPTTTTAGTVGQLIEDTTNGKLYICTDATNPYVWEEIGAGGGPTVVQTTGTSTTDVMSQNAVTSMIYRDPANRTKIRIGDGGVNGDEGVSIGKSAFTKGNYAIAIGPRTGSQTIDAPGGVSLGAFARAAGQGQVSIGLDGVTSQTQAAYGYNGSSYRLLTGVYDGQSAHDAATVGQINATIDAINTALSTNIPHIGA